MQQTVLVTGGSGFIALWCILTLLKQGYIVRATAASVSKKNELQLAIQKQMNMKNIESLQFVPTYSNSGEHSWTQAVSGCEYVLYIPSPETAGPDSSSSTKSEVRHILEASDRAKVRKVVITSVLLTAEPLESKLSFDPGYRAYVAAKMDAESAAWQYMKQNSPSFLLVSVFPGTVLGPMMCSDMLGSVELVSHLLQGKMLPNLGLWIVDVRDLAELHATILKSSKCNARYIAVSDFLWTGDMIHILSTGLSSCDAEKVAKYSIPTALLDVATHFFPQLLSLRPLVDRRVDLKSDTLQVEFGFEPRLALETVMDCAYSLLGKLSTYRCGGPI